MFGFFKKKEMDIDAAKSFWNWYVENDSLLIDKLKSHSMDIVDLIDSHLSLVFPYFKSIEFQLGGLIDGKYEFLFFHCGNKYLQRDAVTLKNMMPATLSNHIDFKIEKWIGVNIEDYASKVKKICKMFNLTIENGIIKGNLGEYETNQTFTHLKISL